jgi:mono/diheme cytochrome c family protein
MRISKRNIWSAAGIVAFAAGCHGPLPVNHDEHPKWVEFRDGQEELLSSYAQVDAEEGVYQIPVDRALAMVADDPSLLEPVVEPVKAKPIEEMTLVERGEYHFNNTYVCASCHAFDGSRKVGPPLNDRWGEKALLEGGEEVVFDDEYFRESVWYSRKKIARGYPAAMPVFEGQMSEEDYEAIKAYVKTYQ